MYGAYHYPYFSYEMVMRQSSEESIQKWRALSDTERTHFLNERRRDIAYKTSLCRYWKVLGYCNYGEECRFAHGITELRAPPP
uniref:C3H1-type domain-containing protein n=1 Tax=Panagrolaimus sp. ES5 TaxID=591445 RepID=A0AC34FTS6_9BILA